MTNYTKLFTDPFISVVYSGLYCWFDFFWSPFRPTNWALGGRDILFCNWGLPNVSPFANDFI